ncbi:MAG: type II toxin-antitoxin system RelE family toxin [Gammaproteobacteria bacterium]
MANYSVRIKKSAIKEIEAIATKSDRRRIVKRIQSLADDPRPPGARKLSGHDHYRIRQGRYRILYTIRDRELLVYTIRIADRKEAYRTSIDPMR